MAVVVSEHGAEDPEAGRDRRRGAHGHDRLDGRALGEVVGDSDGAVAAVLGLQDLVTPGGQSLGRGREAGEETEGSGHGGRLSPEPDFTQSRDVSAGANTCSSRSSGRSKLTGDGCLQRQLVRRGSLHRRISDGAATRTYSVRLPRARYRHIPPTTDGGDALRSSCSVFVDGVCRHMGDAVDHHVPDLALADEDEKFTGRDAEPTSGFARSERFSGHQSLPRGRRSPVYG